MKRLMVICLAMFLVTLGISAVAYSAQPVKCLGSNTVSDIVCVIEDCDIETAGDELSCSWIAATGAGKYSLDVEIACEVDDMVEEYDASYGTSEYGETLDATELCLNLDMIAVDLNGDLLVPVFEDWGDVEAFIDGCDGIDEVPSAIVKVKGLQHPKQKNPKCAQNNVQATEDILDLVSD